MSLVMETTTGGSSKYYLSSDDMQLYGRFFDQAEGLARSAPIQCEVPIGRELYESLKAQLNNFRNRGPNSLIIDGQVELSAAVEADFPLPRL
jgi:hypothetical protein